MKRRTLWLCRVIVQLNRIPRYGRLYPMTKEPPHFGPARWKFQRDGHWGFSILHRLNLFWPYVDECMTGAPWVTPEQERALLDEFGPLTDLLEEAALMQDNARIDSPEEHAERSAIAEAMLEHQADSVNHEEGDDDGTTDRRPTEHDGLA